MDWTLILFVIAVAVFFGFAFVYEGKRYVQKVQRTLRPLGELVEGGRFEGRLLKLTLKGSYQGRPVQFWILARGGRTPPGFCIALDCAARFTFRISRERFGKSLGTDVKVGEPELDRQFVFYSDKPQRLADLMARPGVKGTVASLLLSEGATSLELGGGLLQTTYDLPRQNWEKLTPESVRGPLQELEALARSSEGLM